MPARFCSRGSSPWGTAAGTCTIRASSAPWHARDRPTEAGVVPGSSSCTRCPWGFHWPWDGTAGPAHRRQWPLLSIAQYPASTTWWCPQHTAWAARAVCASRQRPRQSTDWSSCDHAQSRTSAAPQVPCRHARRFPSPPPVSRSLQRSAQSEACFLRCGFVLCIKSVFYGS